MCKRLKFSVTCNGDGLDYTHPKPPVNRTTFIFTWGEGENRTLAACFTDKRAATTLPTPLRVSFDDWSVRLDSNQRPLASKARTLTRLSYAQRSWVLVGLGFS